MKIVAILHCNYEPDTDALIIVEKDSRWISFCINTAKVVKWKTETLARAYRAGRLFKQISRTGAYYGYGGPALSLDWEFKDEYEFIALLRQHMSSRSL